MSSSSKATNHESNTIWVLTDASPYGAAETLLPSAPVAIDAEKLGEQLQEFITAFSKSLDSVTNISVNGFNLSQVSVNVQLTASLGLILIGQAGVTSGITLTFTRK